MTKRLSATRVFAISLLALLLPGFQPVASLASPPPVTREEIRHLPRDCPIVYDNDWLKDTNDDEYLFAKASLGEAKLRGVVLTKDEWDRGRQYKVEDGLKDFRSNLEIVRRSGWKHIPDVTIGADRLLHRPASSRILDTMPVASAGTELIVAEARRATPRRPLVVIVGGPLITVASAYLTDPSIGDRMVVFMTDLTGYNGSDSWANFIVATRCKLVNFGASPLWWPQRPLPPVMPPDRFDRLPDRQVTCEMKRVAAMFWERSTRARKPDRDDGLGDGAGTFLLFRPESWRDVRKMRVTGAWSAQPVSDSGVYHYLDATRVDFGLMSDEFFATLHKALEGGPVR
ncbi:MAG: hypothetical protein ACP5XB_22785 [Isosphaeraceae bacterium]